MTVGIKVRGCAGREVSDLLASAVQMIEHQLAALGRGTRMAGYSVAMRVNTCLKKVVRSWSHVIARLELVLHDQCWLPAMA